MQKGTHKLKRTATERAEVSISSRIALTSANVSANSAQRETGNDL